MVLLLNIAILTGIIKKIKQTLTLRLSEVDLRGMTGERIVIVDPEARL